METPSSEVLYLTKYLKLTSYGPKVKKYKSILLKLVLLLYYLRVPVKIYYIHMYTTREKPPV